mmetsp:Transcript_68567/g.146708  ORF Transcript_68567/g.146708 Transcript_68567/m.146708 type:complete len:319 (-) Transcript_68567:392-1348(-)
MHGLLRGAYCAVHRFGDHRRCLLCGKEFPDPVAAREQVCALVLFQRPPDNLRLRDDTDILHDEVAEGAAYGYRRVALALDAHPFTAVPISKSHHLTAHALDPRGLVWSRRLVVARLKQDLLLDRVKNCSARVPEGSHPDIIQIRMAKDHRGCGSRGLQVHVLLNRCSHQSCLCLLYGVLQGLLELAVLQQGRAAAFLQKARHQPRSSRGWPMAIRAVPIEDREDFPLTRQARDAEAILPYSYISRALVALGVGRRDAPLLKQQLGVLGVNRVRVDGSYCIGLFEGCEEHAVLGECPGRDPGAARAATSEGGCASDGRR